MSAKGTFERKRGKLYVRVSLPDGTLPRYELPEGLTEDDPEAVRLKVQISKRERARVQRELERKEEADRLLTAAPPPLPWPDVRGVYFVFAPVVARMKIGWSDCVRVRLQRLLASPVRLELMAVASGAPVDERRFHRQFAPQRCHGEWFEVCDDMWRVVNHLRRRLHL